MTNDNRIHILMQIGLYKKAKADDPYMLKAVKDNYLENSEYYERLEREIQEDSGKDS